MGRFSYFLIFVGLLLFNLAAFAWIAKIAGGDDSDRLMLMYTFFFWAPVLLATVVMNFVFLLAFFFPMEHMSHEESEDWVKDKKRLFKRHWGVRIVREILDEIF